MGRTVLVPVVVLAFCVLPLAGASLWWLLLLAVPAVLAAGVLRYGVDVGDDGITARTLVGARTVPWSELTGIRVGRRADLWLVTTADTEVRLPVLRTRDLPQLAALSGGRIPAP